MLLSGRRRLSTDVHNVGHNTTHTKNPYIYTGKEYNALFPSLPLRKKKDGGWGLRIEEKNKENGEEKWNKENEKKK